MQRVVEELVARRKLDDAAEIHDRDALAEMPHYRQVVGDEQVGKAEPFAHILKPLMTCAWIDTSSAETASSQTMNSGSKARARAIPTRWRWPPASGQKACASD